MAFTKIAAAGIGSTETVTLHSLEVINNATVGGVLTYEDVTNVDSIGLITARNGVVVGSGITLSKDGDGFFTGIVTATQYYGDGSTLSNVTSTTINNNGTSRIITGSGTANTLNAKANLTFDNTSFLVGSGVTISKDGHGFFAGIATVGRQIVGSSTNNLVPFLFNNYSDLPSASDYHGQFAHVHVAGKAFYAHAGAWTQLVNVGAEL